jgi:type II secretory pathway pseudopilin PulG
VSARPREGGRAEAGFSLPELLVATVLLVAVTGGVFGLLDPAQGTFRAQPEAIDMQQRLRVAVEALQHDLLMAGAGPYHGAAGGPLVYSFAPILPWAAGVPGAGGPGAPTARAITISYVPSTSAQATIRDDLLPGSSDVQVVAQPGCPPDDPACGFTEGMRALVFDPSGASGVFTVTDVRGVVLQVQHRGGPAAIVHRAGSCISHVVSHAYYLDDVVHRVQRYDGHASNLPVVDNVAGLGFEYFGEPAAPALRRPVSDPVGPWTTYGPRPPPVGVDETGDDWGPGENCAFRVVDGQHLPRLPDLSAGPPGALVPLPLELLADGPWCPGASNGAGLELTDRFDADLLRVRRVRVTVRVQVAPEALRGRNPAGATLFANPGTSRSGHALVPDHEIRFEVTPRNMHVGR